MIVIADNDLIQKLARCDLLDSLPTLLQVPFEEIFIAPAARFQLLPHRPEKALAKCGNIETVERIRKFLGAVKDVPAVADIQLLARLAEVDGIDPGEQLLFASCVGIKEFRLLTGDRTALNALKSSAALADVQKALAENVMTFESALLIARSVFGFEFIKNKLLEYPQYNKEGVLKFLVKQDMVEADFEECLVSYSRSVSVFLANRVRLPASLFEDA